MSQPPENLEPQQPDANSTQQPDNSTRQNVVRGNQNRVVQGNENKSVLGDNNTVSQGNNNWLANTWNIFFGRSDSNELTNPRNRVQQILLKQVSTEVESRINSSLHNRVYIVLDVDQNPSQIELPWESEIKVGSKPKIHLTNTQIATVYDQPDIAGRLLILGQPGVGKTTMLLKLAEELVTRAKNDSEHPIPVLFSLSSSSWKNDSQSIKDWLVEQLKDKYGVRKDIGNKWVENQEIIPLLDGLNEIAAERQEQCVRKINDFLHTGWSNPLVVCSRTQEYQHYATLLQLNNSLELYSFTQEQVYQYLQKTGNSQLWESISNNTDLNQLARTPLLLNIIVISVQEISQETWQQFKSSEERLTYLFDAYIRKMLKRPYKDKKNKDKEQPNQENTLRWLGWLAQQLSEEYITEFLIERMQPNLLKKKSRIVYNLIVYVVIQTLIGGLIGGLIIGLSGELIIGLILGLSGGLILGLSGGLIGDKIEAIETLKFSFYKFFTGLIYGLILGLVFGLFYGLGGLSYGLEGLIFGLTVGLTVGLFNGLIYGLTLGLIFGVNGLEIQNKTISNQGIWQSAKNTVKLSALFFLLSTVLIFVIQRILQTNNSLNEALIFSLMSGLFLGLLVGIPRSGTPVIKHFILRLILYFNGYIPWNYARFLDYCTERLFLQRVGGRYRFMHKLLQDHFAQMEFRRN